MKRFRLITQELKPGDKVIGPYLYCEILSIDIRRTNCCTDLRFWAYILMAAWRVFLPSADMLVKMPEDMDWTDATMAEPRPFPSMVSLRGWIEGREYCAIIGAG